MMSTIDEALAMATVDDVEAICTIDTDSRKISIPQRLLPFGVESDEKSNRIRFKMPNIFGNDVSNLSFYINYKNADGAKDVYIIDDVSIVDEYIYFTWILHRNVTVSKGSIYFILCVRKSDENGIITFEWNTTLATATVLEGLEAEIIDDPEAYCIIQQLLEKMNDLEDKVKKMSGGSAKTIVSKAIQTDLANTTTYTKQVEIESGGELIDAT